MYKTGRIVLVWLTLLAVLPGQVQTVAASEQMGQFLGGQQSESPAWFKDSFLEFRDDIDEAAANGKRVMIYFHQEGCPYCNLLVEESFSNPAVVDRLTRNFDSIAVNMWGDREIVTVSGHPFSEKAFAAALGVNYTPTLLFFEEGGKVALRLNGYYPPDRFRMALDYVAGRKEKEMSFNQYVASLRRAGTGTLNRQTFFQSPPYVLTRNQVPARRPLAVFFEEKDCGRCDVLHSRILARDETRELLGGFDRVQLDMWADTPVVTPDGRKTTAREWAAELDLNYAPSVVFFDTRGKEVMRIEAFLKTFHFQSVLDYVRGEAYLTEPSFQRFIEARADAIREKGIDVDIWSY